MIALGILGILRAQDVIDETIFITVGSIIGTLTGVSLRQSVKKVEKAVNGK
jgi:hypothetical protein